MPLSTTATGPDRAGGPTAIFCALAGGTLAGLRAVGSALAVATLLFAPSFPEAVPAAFGSALLASAFCALVLAIGSRLPCAVGHVQDVPVAIVAPAVAVLATGTSSTSGAPGAATGFAIVAACSLATALVQLTLAALRAGRLLRFLPQPVTVGFLAACGVLLLTGGVALVAGKPPSLSAWGSLADPGTAAVLLPAAVLAAMLFLASRFAHPLVLPALLVAAVVAPQWVAFPGAGASGPWPAEVAEAVTAGPAAVVGAAELARAVDWGAVAGASPTILAVALLTPLAALLNTNGLETACGREIEVDRETAVTGIGNLFAAAVAAPPVFVAIGSSLFAWRLGARGPLVGVATAFVLLAALFLTGRIVALVPPFVAAGLVLFLGVDLVVRWLFASGRRMPLREWLVVPAIVVVAVGIGFLEALALGLVVATVGFALHSAALPAVRRSADLAAEHSSVERTPEEWRLLAPRAGEVEIVHLQGYLFFGSAEQIVTHVARRLACPARPALRHLLLDFRRVTALDTSAIGRLERIGALGATHGFRILACGLSSRARRALHHGVSSTSTTREIEICADLDRALARIESGMLGERPNGRHSGIRELLVAQGESPEDVARLLSAMRRREWRRGDVLMTQGAPADELHIVESGSVRIRRLLADGVRETVRSMGAGAVLGEIGGTLGTTRTAAVVAERPTVTWALSFATLRKLERQEPGVALALHRVVARALAEKVLTANRVARYAR